MMKRERKWSRMREEVVKKYFSKEVILSWNLKDEDSSMKRQGKSILGRKESTKALGQK